MSANQGGTSGRRAAEEEPDRPVPRPPSQAAGTRAAESDARSRPRRRSSPQGAGGKRIIFWILPRLGEGRGRRRSPLEKETEHPDDVGKRERSIVVEVRRVGAGQGQAAVEV